MCVCCTGINGSELLRRIMASAALMRTSKKACGKKHVPGMKKAYRKATRAVLKRACYEWPTQKVISNCKQDSTYVTSQLALNMTTWGSNGWYYGPCCFNIFCTQRLLSVSWNICREVMCLSWCTIFYTCCAVDRVPPQRDSIIGVSPRFVAKLPRDFATRIPNTALCQNRI